MACYSTNALSKYEFIDAVVDFIDVEDEYSISRDLLCKCKLNRYEVQEGDKIAIFKIGWCQIKDAVIMEDVTREENCNYANVIFEESNLPKDESELYQFCYITSKNELYGASSAFRITAGAHQTSSSLLKIFCDLEIQEQPTNHPEYQQLKEENLTLKRTLKLLVDKQLYESVRQEHTGETFVLKAQIDRLKKFVAAQHIEMKILKEKIKAVEEECQRASLENASLKTEFEELKVSTQISQLRDNVNEPRSSQNINSLDCTFLDNIPDLPPFPFSESDL